MSALTLASKASSGSTLSEVPGINCAVGHLQELANRMKGIDFGFGEVDVNNVDGAIEALGITYDECCKLREKYETETIKSSILRHRLQFLPDEIKTEMQVAVTAARQSDANEQAMLEEALSKINENITCLQERLRSLEEYNATLHPCRDKVRQEHEEIVAMLNQRMAEKAGKQITLNETRDNVRETNQKIVDLEDGIMQLKEELIQERAEARVEKKRLKKSVFDTTTKVRAQKEVNVEKKKELDHVFEKTIESDSHLESVRESIRKSEMQKSKYEGQERALEVQLEREIKSIEAERVKGITIREEIIANEEEFEERRKELMAKMVRIDETLTFQVEKNDGLVAEKNKATAVLDAAEMERMSTEQMVKFENQKLQDYKHRLATMAEEVARLAKSTTSMEETLAELQETHEAIMGSFKARIDEFRTQLSKERKERFQLQDRRQSSQMEMEKYKVDSEKQMIDTNKHIIDGKMQHDSLTKEGINLQKAIGVDSKSLEKLKEKVSKRRASYEELKYDRVMEIRKLKEQIDNMVTETEAKEQLVSDRIPPFEDLETQYKEASENYEIRKKELVALKSEKLKLADLVKAAKEQLAKLTKPVVHLQEDLKLKRAEALQQLKANGEDLKKALEENHKFEQANALLEHQMTVLVTQMEDNDQRKKKLQTIFQQIRAMLEIEWKEEDAMEKTFAERDAELLVDMAQVLEHAKAREGIIAGVSEKLTGELTVLADFLDNVEKRRPKDSREPSRRRRSTRMAPTASRKERKSMPVNQVSCTEAAVTQSYPQPRPPSRSPRPLPPSRSPSVQI
ncbi:hypothetical protein LSAT2_028106 [Lamellibrachia satsuma]|nr:hypothetical protein LSAT2_028106 [Lamellibrachia satsuma]